MAPEIGQKSFGGFEPNARQDGWSIKSNDNTTSTVENLSEVLILPFTLV